MIGHVDYVDLRAQRREQGLPERLVDDDAVDRAVSVLLAGDQGHHLLPHESQRGRDATP